VAIWLKKFSYSITVKVTVIILFMVSAFFMVNSAIGIREMPQQENWYDNFEVSVELGNRAGFVRDWIVRYADEDIFNPKKVTKEQIENYKNSNDTIQDDKKAVESIIKDRKAYFKEIQRILISDNVNVEFLAINVKTGKVITNIKNYNESNKDTLKENFNKRQAFIIGNGSSILETNSMDQNTYDNYKVDSYYKGDSFEEEENYEVYIATSGGVIKEGDWVYQSMNEFNRRVAIKDNVYLFGIIGLSLSFILLLAWIKIVGQREKGGPIKLRLLDKIPFEVQLVSFSLIMTLWLIVTGRILSESRGSDWLPYAFNPSYVALDTEIFLCISVGGCITLLFISSIIKHIKNHTMQKYIIVIRLSKWLFKNLITEKTLPLVVFLGVGAYPIINLIFTYIILRIAHRSGVLLLIGMAWMLAFNVAVALGVFKVVLDYSKILTGSKQIAQGNLKVKIELNKALPIMNDMAHTINHIGEGLGNAVENSLKSERLKAELITNVSHDLKTPLTSIISYIDLLKEEPIANNTAKEYIQILEERSNRLKQLVEDLVDASKAVTGNVKTDLAKVELHQLVRQAVGEYTDRLEASGLTVIMNKIEDVYILADGRHMYRVLENLLSNVNKYAMPQTRVYIDVMKDNEYGKLAIKNVSREYLNIDPSELTKRFVRGDSARSTEGSGLGLAIAESLVKIQGGIFTNDIDGDLFKVEIKMPIC